MSRRRLFLGGRSRDRFRDERSARSEAGDTLIEVLLALVVLGLASVALLIAFSTSMSASAEHRNLATADAAVAAATQEAISSIQQNEQLFLTCYPASDYPQNIALPSPYDTSSYSASVTQVEYWNGNGASPLCQTNGNYPIPEQITITVMVNGVAHTNDFWVNFPWASSSDYTNSNPAYQLVFTTSPAGGVAGVPFATQPVVAVEDQYGNPVTNDFSPVILSITGSSGVSLSGCSGSENLGIVTFSGCSIATAGGPYTITATDGSLTSSVNVTISVNPATYYLLFTQQPVAGYSGNPFNESPQVTIYNSSHQQVTTGPYSSATVTLTASGGIFSPASCLTLTLSGGVATMPSSCTFAGGYLYNPVSQVTLATPYTLTASATGVVPTTSNTFSVSKYGTATHLVFSTQPSGVASGTPTAVFTVQPAVAVEDSFGNLVTSGFSPSVNLTISNGALTCTGGNSAAASGGIASFSGCHGSAYGNGLTLSASASTVTGATSASFNITQAATQLVFTAQPVAGVSGTPFTTQPAVTFEDAAGNVVTSATAPITLTPSGGTLSICTGLTPSSGVANVENCTFAGIIGTNYTLTAASPGLTSAISSTFSPTGPGVPTQLVFTTYPVAGAAGSPLTTQPVIKVEDSAGNVVTTSSATVTLSTSAGTLSGCTGLQAASGVVNVANCSFGGLVGTQYQVIAQSPPLTQATYSSISPSGPGPASQISAISGSGQSATVGSTYSNPLVAMVSDAFGNPISGATVTFTPPGSGATVAFAGGQNTAVTGVSGQASSAIMSTNHVAGSFAISASASGAGSVNFNETNTAQTTNDTMSIVQGNNQSTTVGTAFPTTLEVQVLDQYANPVPNVSVTFSAPASGASATFASGGNCTSNPQTYSCVASTNASGDATASILTANHAPANNYSVATSAPGVASPSTFMLTNLVGAASQVGITPTPSSATASATTNFGLALQLEDQYGNATTSTTSTTLTLSTSSTKGFFNAANGGTGTLGGTINVTIPANGTGLATTYYGDETAAMPSITAKNGSNTWGTTTLTVTAGAAHTIVVTSGSSQSATVNTTFTNKLVAMVTDTYGNPVPGVTVTFAPPGSGASATFAGNATTAVTGTNGQATSVAITANTTAGAYNIGASATGTGSVNFAETNTAGAAHTIVVTSGSGQSATVNAPFTNPLVATVTDTYGNPVTGVTVTFAPPGSGASATFAGNVKTAVTATNGQATSAAISANTVAGGPYNISASATGAGSVNFAETNTAGAASQVGITPAPGSAAASATTNFGLALQLEDQYGNATTSATSTTLTLSTSSSKGFFNAAYGGTGTLGAAMNVTIPANGIGLATTYYGDETAATPTITAKNGSNTWGTTTVTVTANAANTIVVTSGSGQSATVNTAFTNKLVATVTDTYGNPVSGITVTFAPPGSGATATFAGNVKTAVTAANGQATSAAITANTTAGGYNVGASAIGTGSVNFAETNSAGAASKVSISPTPGSAVASATTNIGLALQLEDQYNNATTSASATTITLSTSSSKGFFNAASGGTGTLGGTINVTIPANGTGSSTSYYGDETAGTPTITAKNGSSTWGTRSVTVTAGTAHTIVVSSGSGQSAALNTAFTNPLVATVTDTYGNPVSGVTVTFAPPGSGASATFAGGNTTALTGSNGQATSAVVTANGTPGSYNISASATGTGSVNFAETNAPLSGQYSGSSNGSMTSGSYYYSINATSNGSSTSTANTFTPGVAETLTKLTFTMNSSSPSTHSATVGLVNGSNWTATSLTCSVAGNSGNTVCSITSSVTIPVGDSINILGVGNGFHSGSWTVAYTQP